MVAWLAAVNSLVLGTRPAPIASMDGGRIIHSIAWKMRPAQRAASSLPVAGRLLRVQISPIGLEDSEYRIFNAETCSASLWLA